MKEVLEFLIGKDYKTGLLPVFIIMYSYITGRWAVDYFARMSETQEFHDKAEILKHDLSFHRAMWFGAFPVLGALISYYYFDTSNGALIYLFLILFFYFTKRK